VSRRAWDDVLLEAARAIRDRRYQAAIDRLSDFLRETESRQEQSEALALRGTVRAQLGEAEAAELDLERAHSLSGPGGYHRYTIELLLADAARKRSDFGAARVLYASALETALAGSDFSAGTALEGLLQVIGGGKRSDAEDALIGRAVSASWRALRIDAEMPSELGDCITRILVAERGGAPTRAR
jgi:hypothetical protein